MITHTLPKGMRFQIGGAWWQIIDYNALRSEEYLVRSDGGALHWWDMGA